MPDLQYHDGVKLDVGFELANVPANANTNMTMGAGNTSFVVPDGMKAWPYFLIVNSNADLTAGTLTCKITSSGTVVSNGPEPQLADTVQRKAAFIQPGAVSIAAGGLIGVQAQADANFAPNTADLDVILGVILVPDPS